MKTEQIQKLENLEDLGALIENRDIIQFKYILKFDDVKEVPLEIALVISPQTPTIKGLFRVILPHPSNPSLIQSYFSLKEHLKLKDEAICFYEEKTVIENYHCEECYYQKLKDLLITSGLIQ